MNQKNPISHLKNGGGAEGMRQGTKGIHEKRVKK